MAKKPLGLSVGLIIGLAALVLILLLALLWQSGIGPQSRHTSILLTRLQNVQKLQVLEARLLAHRAYQDPALLNTNEFLIVARGKAIYGLDLARAQIRNEGDKVQLSLPPVRLMEMVMNPDDIEFVGLKKGLLTSQQAFEAIKREQTVGLQAELTRQSRDPELLRQAETNARQYLQTLITSLGIQNVTIQFEAALP